MHRDGFCRAGSKCRWQSLVFQDYLQKWPEVYAVANRKAETVAGCLVDLIWRHGIPNRTIHDRAAEFLSVVIQKTAYLMGMAQLPTSGGHPQTNGLVERFNRTLKQMLSKQVSKKGRNWDKMLGGVLHVCLQKHPTAVNRYVTLLSLALNYHQHWTFRHL